MAIDAYAEVLAALYRLEAAKGMDFKLERVALALKNLGNPQRRFATIHIAGTNGKGSVAAMLHAMFGAGGYRVGLYTSPHLVSFTERIRIGTHEISEGAVVELAREIQTAATVRGIELTFFEFVTVMSFLHFARQGVDLAVVEVGLGGRLDATNVVDPAVSVITTIALDHEEFLGDTLDSIAREKAGIIKPGRPVVIGNVPSAIVPIFERVAQEQGANARRVGRDYAITGEGPVRFSGMGCRIEDIDIALRGAYQRDNAATAIATVVQLRPMFPLSDEAIRCGLASVRWPGRLDVVESHPLVVLDGAHNVDGIRTLVQELPSVVGNRRLHVLFAVMRDKRWELMVDAIGPLATSATVTSLLAPRGANPELVAEAFERYCASRTVYDPVEGIDTLLRTVDPSDAVVVTGSLFLIGAIYPYFLNRRGQPTLFSTSGVGLQP